MSLTRDLNFSVIIPARLRRRLASLCGIAEEIEEGAERFAFRQWLKEETKRGNPQAKSLAEEEDTFSQWERDS